MADECSRHSVRWDTSHTVVDNMHQVLRRSLAVFVVVLVAALLSTVMFSSWNVCRPDYEDDVDVRMAAVPDSFSSSTRRPRRPAKTCLSPLTDDGKRYDVSLDSYNDLQR